MEGGDEASCTRQAGNPQLQDIPNSSFWEPRIKKLLTKSWRHQESERVFGECGEFLGKLRIAAKNPGSLFPRQRVRLLSE